MQPHSGGSLVNGPSLWQVHAGRHPEKECGTGESVGNTGWRFGKEERCKQGGNTSRLHEL
eukprot:165358-Chlamydomonas_euryale.AAC.3